MPNRRYVERITRADEGAHVVDRADDLSDVTMVTRQGHVLRGDELKAAADQDLTVFRSHFASCPKAKAFRSSETD